MHMLRAIREAARRVRGVSLIEVLYGTGGVGRMKV